MPTDASKLDLNNMLEQVGAKDKDEGRQVYQFYLDNKEIKQSI